MNDLNLRAARMRLRMLITAVAFAILLSIAITTGAFVLSFAVLRELAQQAQMPFHLAYILPLVVDFAILNSTVGVIVFSKIDSNNEGDQKRKNFFVWLLIAMVLISVVGNALHAYMAAGEAIARAAAGFDVGPTPLPPVAAAVVAIIPPLLVLAFTHGVGLLITGIGSAYSEYKALVVVFAAEAEDGAGNLTEAAPEEIASTVGDDEPVLWDHSDFLDDQAPAGSVSAQYDEQQYDEQPSAAWDEPVVRNVVAAEPVVTPVFTPAARRVSAEPAFTSEPFTAPVAIPKPAPEPVVAKVAFEPVAAPVVEPVTAAVAEPVAESAAELAVEPVVGEPVAEPIAEPVAEPVVESVAELVEEPVSEAVQVDEPIDIAPAVEDISQAPAFDSSDPSVMELLAFFQGDRALIHEADKETAIIKIMNPSWDFKDIANNMGVGSDSMVRGRYKRAQKAAVAAGFTFPPLPVIEDEAFNSEMATNTV